VIPTTPTPERLLLPPTAVTVPDWVRVAFGELGVREFTAPGKSNPRIESYHALTRAGIATDDVAWCSSAMCFVFEMAGIRSTQSKMASSWSTWGIELPLTAPLPFGCLLFFGHDDPDAARSGHVALNVGVSKPEVFILGGNQSDRWGVDSRKYTNISTARWPAGLPIPKAG
jgi:uncharacterized protein (TIGR02594 family)